MSNEVSGSVVVWAGLGAAAAFGAGDFSGGIAAKRDPVTRVVALAHLISLVLFLVLAILVGEARPRLVDLGWGVLAGIMGAIGLLALYEGLARGPMGVVAPTSAVLGATLPVLVDVALGGLFHPIQVGGMCLALLGVVLLSLTPSQGQGGLGLAIVAGLGFGSFFVLIAQTQGGSVFWPLTVARLASATLLSLRAWRLGSLRPVASAPIVASALLDALGNLLFVVAAQTGQLAEASVLTNIYPLFTVLLALVVLRERLRATQWVGLAITLIAVLLITFRE